MHVINQNQNQDVRVSQHSPRHLGTSMLNQHVLAPSRESSFRAIKVELKDRILYDDSAVFKRVRIDDVADDFVQQCRQSVEKEQKGSIATLKKLAKAADGISEHILEDEEERDRATSADKQDKSGNHGSAQEKKMYSPLEKIFSHITNFVQPGRTKGTPRRVFLMTNSMLKPEEPQTFGFASVSPDFTGVKNGTDPRSKSWTGRELFGEIKPSSKQSPRGSKDNTVPPIVIQCSNYSRLFMSARPFMLFCTGLLIFGTKFCVGIFDREGISFSPIHDLFEDLGLLVRVVRSFTNELSANELGLDPSVQSLDIEETRRLTTGQGNDDEMEQENADKIGKGNDAVKTFLGGNILNYSSTVVTVSTLGVSRQWCTIGYPIWTSQSLLGRGTNVWHVCEYLENQKVLKGPVMVLKTAWRNSARTSESDIYRHLENQILSVRGLCKFECGGDVVLPGSSGNVISVQALRRPESSASALGILDTLPTPVLHRLILSTVGRPLWQYASDIQVLKAFRDAIHAHKSLVRVGILHRDISAGNILLTVDQSDGLFGLLTDIEFARISESTIRTPLISTTSLPNDQQRQHIRFDVISEVKRGAPMTGTAQFMARELLLEDADYHEPKHDLESFIWAFAYAVLRNVWQKANRSASQPIKSEAPIFSKRYQAIFIEPERRLIADKRTGHSWIITFVKDRDIQDIVQSFMTSPLIELFRDFQIMIQRAQLIVDTVPLTYDILLGAVDKALASS